MHTESINVQKVPPNKARRAASLRRSLLRRFRAFWLFHASSGIRKNSEGLARSYAANLAHRLPLIYAVLVIDILVLSMRFIGRAPAVLAILVPLALGAFAAWRGIYWMPALVRRRSNAVLVRDLERMTLMGGYFALLLAGWTLLLFPFGDQGQQSFVQYVTAVTCYTAILGLAQSPRTAGNIALAVMLPSTLYHIFQSHPNALAVGIVQIVVTALLLAVTNGYHRDFIRLEISRRNLARREQETARLSEMNLRTAMIDPLTGALNRGAFLAQLEQELRTARDPAWLALLDMDGFKHVNDTYGHAAGDAVLQAVAERLEKLDSIRAYGRLGGDEFAVLLDGGLDEEAARTLMHRLSDALRAPIYHNGVTLRLAASIGLSRAERGSVEDCLERSDEALYKAKDAGRGAGGGVVEVFTSADEVALRHRTAVTRCFNDCSLDDRLQLVYQPIVEVEGGAITGYEAFARWSPDGATWLGPDHFLSLAQATGRTGELTRLVLTRALAETALSPGRELSINLSPRDVLREGTDDVLAQIVEQAGASPEQLMLEVTERALHHDPRRSARQLARFRERGFRIALDDFGAGWSSLSHVRTLPLNRIKIDRGLATTLGEDPGTRAIAGTIVTLAWQMGLECTIEGIETERQYETARALGLRLMQGYYFGHPRPVGEIPELLPAAALRPKVGSY